MTASPTASEDRRSVLQPAGRVAAADAQPSAHGNAPLTRRIELSGEMDAASAHRLRAALHDALDGGAVVVVVDVAAMTFVDGRALGVLNAAQRRARADGRTVLLCSPRRALLRVLAVTALDRVLPVCCNAEGVAQEGVRVSAPSEC